MAITYYTLSDGTTIARVLATNQPEPDPEPKFPIDQDQTGFSLSDLEPYEPEPFVEVPTDSKLKPSGKYDELWDLLNKLVLDPDADGNTRFMP